jgi:16S rRNA (guanine966-N2)-methyltransferase
MRITGGEYRGRTIYSGKSKDIRPATDRVRETIFAILPQYIDFSESTVVDLYAGTGSLGFECLSRGSKFVFFVDASREGIKGIKRTAEELQCLDRCDILLSSVERYLQNPGIKGNLIFADPPYAMKGLEELPDQIAHSGICEPDAILLIEHSKHTDFPVTQSYSIFRQKVFGNTIVSFFHMY